MEALLSRLNQSQAKTAKILSDYQNIIRDQKQNEPIDMCEKNIQKYETACETQKKQQQKVNVTKQQHLNEKQCESELLQVKIDAEKKLIASLQKELDHLQEEQATLTKGIPQGSSEEKARQLEAEEALFKHYMATEINKVQGGWLQVIFTQIDPAKTSSKFFFMFKVDETRRYVVGDCQPPIKDMDVLVRNLNSTNDLGKFVHSVRKRFKQAMIE
ncbi:kinetochore protein Spc25-like [Elysia marginata]|uniref:Kinetochore protein SPC25 n=1 Tax=Elysia marginata TaxID=1093978 RepID=A0AAV4F152_9GAST|nr:kinetochore protein Spc25-like [Elysia marginata]